jgi:predicted DNA-binding protein with PD1-like motif
MNFVEARRVRHLLLRLDAGDPLPAALQKVLGDAEIQAGCITGVGRLEAVELVADGRGGGALPVPRRFEGPSELVNLTGVASRSSGVLEVALWVTVAREAESGLQTVGGKLLSARAAAVDLHVIAFDDVPLRVTSEPEARTSLGAAAAGSGVDESVSRSKHMAPKEGGPAGVGEVPLVPPRPAKPPDDVEIYPETGDAVMHFHFGECMVIGSDGDRIRLRQTKDGRVREVALPMLRVEEFATLPNGTRHFILTRKN